MDHVEDVSPHQLQHAAIPNDTVDYWEYRDLLALGVLTSFVRHSAKYGITLTKLVSRSQEQSKARLSKAYNALIEHRYLLRIEFTYARPEGTTDRSGQRYSKHSVSRVPISDERFESIVADHAPGKKIMIRYGDPDPETGERELRRVTILAAEVYCHRGGLRIRRDEETGAPVLLAHDKSRARPVVPPAKRPQPPRKPAPREGASGEPEAPSADAPPEVGKLTSGLTCGNVEDPQVQPEVETPEFGYLTSIKKTDLRTTDNQKTESGGASRPPAPPANPNTVADVRSGAIMELEPDGPLTWDIGKMSGLARPTPGDDEVKLEIERQRAELYDQMEPTPNARDRTKQRAPRQRAVS